MNATIFDTHGSIISHLPEFSDAAERPRTDDVLSLLTVGSRNRCTGKLFDIFRPKKTYK